MSFTPTGFAGQNIQVFVNSVDVTSDVFSSVIDRPCFGSASANVVFSKNLINVVTLTAGMTLQIYSCASGGTLTRKFYGVILSVVHDLSGYSVSASDELWKATGKTLTKLYDMTDQVDPFGGDIRLILIDLITKAGLSTGDAYIDQTSVVIPQVLCDSVKIFEKIQELTQAMYWDVYQDPIDRYIKVRDPAGYPTFPTQFEVGTNVTESPNYNENIYQTINEVEVQGIRTFPLTKELFDGTTATYTVQKYPIATYVKVTNNNTGAVLSGATEGSSGSYDYLVNLNKGILTFNSAPGSIMTIEYTATELTSVTVDDSASKVMTQGVRKLVISLPDVADVSDATQRAQAILEESKSSFSNFTLKITGDFDITPRYVVDFYDPLKNLTFIGLQIVKVRESWPEITTEITVGKSQLSLNYLLSSVEERVKKLERVRREGILLRVNKLFTNDMYLVMDDIEITKTPVGAVQQFVLDDNVYGLLDLNYMGLTYGPTQQFILGDLSWGILGTSVLGQEVPGAPDVIVKRRYKYTTQAELATGTYDGNIDISNGDIRFMI